MTTTDPNLNYETPPPPGNLVNAPALALIITAIAGIFLRIIIVLLMALGMVGSAMTNDSQMGMTMFKGTWGIITSIVCSIIGLVIAFGGFKMRNLQNYGLAMTAAVLALLPCSSCCCITLPFGIWAIVVLMKPEVKAAFR
ncbi:MAG TPA: hypothetical protein VH253_11990 [Phycisphaerae bacterium]|nr:hypothetical protein [Phycisphaerae bacterium]